MTRRQSPVLMLSAATTLALLLGCTGQVGGGVMGGGTGSVSGSGSVPGSAGRNGAVGGTGPGGVGNGTGGFGGVADPLAAGVRPLRLLSAQEYLNTVRDLLGDTTTVANAALPTTDEDRSATPAFAFRVDHPVALQDGSLLQSSAESLAKSAVARLTTMLPCATPPAAAAAETTCLNTFMTTFMTKMYRRPLLPAEVTRLMSLYQLGRSTLALGFNDTIGLLIEASLQSPGFLYHWERDPGMAVKEGSVVKLGGYELANRLSYFLWESMPDATLFTAAAAGQLADAASVDAQVRRMLKDPKATGAIVDFFNDWLDVDVLPEISKDAMVYPMYNDALVTAMTSELSSLVTGIVVNGSGRLGDLLTGTNSYANQTLAALYGVTGVTGTALKPVMLNPAQRSGLLTTAAFLATTGDAAESNPPRRGKAIYTKLLCGQLNPLPAVVPPPAPASQGGTLRQRMEEHDKNACTTGCHNIIEPFGFAFEEYGGIGEFRTTDNGQPVDSSGAVTLDGQAHTSKDAPGLLAALATSPSVQSCFATQWLRYGFGRFETAADIASINAAAGVFRSSTGDVREMLVGLATSRTFRYRTPSAGEVLQ